MQMFKVRSRGVIMHEGKLLLVRHADGRDFFALPGGHVDSGENPKECMERELIEELGVRPVIGKLLYVYTYINKEGVHAVEFFFEIQNGADYLHHEEVEKTHAHEIAEARWVSPEEMLKILPLEFCAEFKAGTIFNEDVRFLKG